MSAVETLLCKTLNYFSIDVLLSCVNADAGLKICLYWMWAIYPGTGSIQTCHYPGSDRKTTEICIKQNCFWMNTNIPRNYIEFNSIPGQYLTAIYAHGLGPVASGLLLLRSEEGVAMGKKKKRQMQGPKSYMASKIKPFQN